MMLQYEMSMDISWQITQLPSAVCRLGLAYILEGVLTSWKGVEVISGNEQVKTGVPAVKIEPFGGLRSRHGSVSPGCTHM
jgi:hypothetical protein